MTTIELVITFDAKNVMQLINKHFITINTLFNTRILISVTSPLR